ncbi:NAD(P)/FAD-dependent oxidoreductase [Glaciimonas sp. PCH181]|uniref:NAD(P)/FAD-dependent oxidoreductase n=1 Tax=Glaciimonas sp. PCH181 TaxID=2133943 RepID=UPI000D3C2254|nr:NAD(P)/FAD-dependent oxidoreductase [Glaciimonas sp. PCH181]PUA19527.1 FAD-dependent oxidoreductase [Glaciimonas sp. PCH181]
MTQRILIVGSGFAGMWSALGAARLLDKEGKSDSSIEVALIAPEPVLHVRPRLHEAAPARMTAPLLPVLEAAGVRYIQGSVKSILTDKSCVIAIDQAGEHITIAYDKLVLATGSKLFRPPLPGLHEHTFSIDQTDEASVLETHLARLIDLQETTSRNTIVVVGGGFTGLEIATELPERLRKIMGEKASFKIIIVERAQAIGPDLGPGPRPVIQKALDALGIECRLGSAVMSVDPDGIDIANGDRIDAKTVIWTGGMRASSLTEQISSNRDNLGRLRVTRDLRVGEVANVFAAGDVALAATDDKGNFALMSCQHAMNMGRFAGYNVAAELLNLPTLPYEQAFYVTCLDLGSWGAVYTEGWEREIKMEGNEAKALKKKIVTEWIYPPSPSRKAVFADADPLRIVVA